MKNINERFNEPLTEDQKVRNLSNYLLGMANASQDPNLFEAHEWLEKLSRDICGQGYIGCSGGSNCDSDHK